MRGSAQARVRARGWNPRAARAGSAGGSGRDDPDPASSGWMRVRVPARPSGWRQECADGSPRPGRGPGTKSRHHGQAPALFRASQARRPRPAMPHGRGLRDSSPAPLGTEALRSATPLPFAPTFLARAEIRFPTSLAACGVRPGARLRYAGQALRDGLSRHWHGAGEARRADCRAWPWSWPSV